MRLFRRPARGLVVHQIISYREGKPEPRPRITRNRCDIDGGKRPCNLVVNPEAPRTSGFDTGSPRFHTRIGAGFLLGSDRVHRDVRRQQCGTIRRMGSAGAAYCLDDFLVFRSRGMFACAIGVAPASGNCSAGGLGGGMIRMPWTNCASACIPASWV